MKSSYNRKYYLHIVLKDAGAEVKSKSKTICITAENYQALSDKEKLKVRELQEDLHYSVQFKLP